jgi:hypothetical protein
MIKLKKQPGIFDAEQGRRGAAALLLVLGVSAALLIMAKSLADIGYLDLDTITSENCGDIALYSAETCVEEALRRIQLESGFIAQNQNVAIDGIACRYSSDSGRIIATGIYDACERSIRADYEDTGTAVRLVSWNITSGAE